MSVCFLCKSFSREPTVLGFFDKSQLDPLEYADLPPQVPVHIVCSLLYKETHLEVLPDRSLQVHGLEQLLKYNKQGCFQCKKCSEDFRKRPFIINCHTNECIAKECKKKKQCNEEHCILVLDLHCMKSLQVFDILIKEDKPQLLHLKFNCKKHSVPSKHTMSTYSDVVNFIIKKFFSKKSALIHSALKEAVKQRNYQKQLASLINSHSDKPQPQSLSYQQSVSLQQSQHYQPYQQYPQAIPHQQQQHQNLDADQQQPMKQSYNCQNRQMSEKDIPEYIEQEQDQSYPMFSNLSYNQAPRQILADQICEIFPEQTLNNLRGQPQALHSDDPNQLLYSQQSTCESHSFQQQQQYQEQYNFDYQLAYPSHKQEFGCLSVSQRRKYSLDAQSPDYDRNEFSGDLDSFRPNLDCRSPFTRSINQKLAEQIYDDEYPSQSFLGRQVYTYPNYHPHLQHFVEQQHYTIPIASNIEGTNLTNLSDDYKPIINLNLIHKEEPSIIEAVKVDEQPLTIIQKTGPLKFNITQVSKPAISHKTQHKANESQIQILPSSLSGYNSVDQSQISYIQYNQQQEQQQPQQQQQQQPQQQQFNSPLYTIKLPISANQTNKENSFTLPSLLYESCGTQMNPEQHKHILTHSNQLIRNCVFQQPFQGSQPRRFPRYSLSSTQKPILQQKKRGRKSKNMQAELALQTAAPAEQYIEVPIQEKQEKDEKSKKKNKYSGYISLIPLEGGGTSVDEEDIPSQGVNPNSLHLNQSIIQKCESDATSAISSAVPLEKQKMNDPLPSSLQSSAKIASVIPPSTKEESEDGNKYSHSKSNQKMIQMKHELMINSTYTPSFVTFIDQAKDKRAKIHAKLHQQQRTYMKNHLLKQGKINGLINNSRYIEQYALTPALSSAEHTHKSQKNSTPPSLSTSASSSTHIQQKTTETSNQHILQLNTQSRIEKITQVIQAPSHETLNYGDTLETNGVTSHETNQSSQRERSQGVFGCFDRSMDAQDSLFVECHSGSAFDDQFPDHIVDSQLFFPGCDEKQIRQQQQLLSNSQKQNQKASALQISLPLQQQEEYESQQQQLLNQQKQRQQQHNQQQLKTIIAEENIFSSFHLANSEEREESSRNYSFDKINEVSEKPQSSTASQQRQSQSQSPEKQHREDDSSSFYSSSESVESFWECSSQKIDESAFPPQENKSNILYNLPPFRISTNSRNLSTSKKNCRASSTTPISSVSASESTFDEFFGVNPSALCLKNFPKCENDDEAVFKWWDQIDDIYFPSTINKAFLKYLQQLERLEPANLESSLTTNQEATLLKAQYSGYYQSMKDSFFRGSPPPFRSLNYLTVLFQCDSSKEEPSLNETFKSTTMNEVPSGLLCVYKLQNYEQKRRLTSEIDEPSESADWQITPNSQLSSTLVEGSCLSDKKNTQLSIGQDISQWEPLKMKKLKFNATDQSHFDKNRTTIKLKKLIELGSETLKKSFFQTHFLNAIVQKQLAVAEQNEVGEDLLDDDLQTFDTQQSEESIQKQRSSKEISEIEQGILSLEYLLSHRTSTQLDIKCLHNRLEEEMNNRQDYLSLRSLSTKVNDVLKWMCIRSNLIQGFSDRVAFDCAKYFSIDVQDRLNINISHAEIIQESPKRLPEVSPEGKSQSNPTFTGKCIRLQHRAGSTKCALNKSKVEEDNQINPKRGNSPIESDCNVCFNYATSENNTVVYCSSCNAGFHKLCYGIDSIPEKQFLCRKCEVQLKQKRRFQSNIFSVKAGVGQVGFLNKKSSQQKESSVQPYCEVILQAEQQFQCRLCSETQMPVTSLAGSVFFYHPTCLFLHNYGVYDDSQLALRENITHEQIAANVCSQSHIACEVCGSRRGLKIRCNGCTKHDIDGEPVNIHCNYYVHALCAFFSGMEVWVEEREDDTHMIAAYFSSRLAYPGVTVNVHCEHHAMKLNRNNIEQAFYRRFQVNHNGICKLFATPEEYAASLIKDNQSWSQLAKEENDYTELYKQTTRVRFNIKDVEESNQIAKESSEDIYIEEEQSAEDVYFEEEDEEVGLHKDTTHEDATDDTHLHRLKLSHVKLPISLANELKDENNPKRSSNYEKKRATGRPKGRLSRNYLDEQQQLNDCGKKPKGGSLEMKRVRFRDEERSHEKQKQQLQLSEDDEDSEEYQNPLKDSPYFQCNEDNIRKQSLRKSITKQNKQLMQLNSLWKAQAKALESYHPSRCKPEIFKSSSNQLDKELSREERGILDKQIIANQQKIEHHLNKPFTLNRLKDNSIQQQPQIQRNNVLIKKGRGRPRTPLSIQPRRAVDPILKVLSNSDKEALPATPVNALSQLKLQQQENLQLLNKQNQLQLQKYQQQPQHQKQSYNNQRFNLQKPVVTNQQRPVMLQISSFAQREFYDSSS